VRSDGPPPVCMERPPCGRCAKVAVPRLAAEAAKRTVAICPAVVTIIPGIFVLRPAGGAVVYVILAVNARSQQADGGSGLPVSLTIALVVMLATEVGALRVALSRGGRE
jgi:hypothetical protein